ncbi:MAG: glycosyltransferase family 9 protein [Flavobacteriales bacterium]
MSLKRIIISRTDSIGDVMLTLPMCVWLKEHIKDVELIYLGRSYTQPVVDCFSVIDEFVDWKTVESLPTSQRVDALKELHADEIIHVFTKKDVASLAKKSSITMRIGTSHRSFHLLTCNHRLNFSRKKSNLHEAQLNFELMRPFGLTEIPSLEKVSAMTGAFEIKHHQLPEEINNYLKAAGKTAILHPKSQGSALEWPMDSYINLAEELVKNGYTVFFTGTETEGELFRKQLPNDPKIIDLTGKMTLTELIYLISQVAALVACSTGPLHIAGFTGIKAVGLYSPKRPIHPGRWQALGKNVSILVNDPDCPTCKKGKSCDCITRIPVDRVLAEIL